MGRMDLDHLPGDALDLRGLCTGTERAEKERRRVRTYQSVRGRS